MSDLPVVESITLQRTAKGWVVIMLKSQGRTIIDEEILSDKPMAREYACNTLRMEVARRFLLPSGRS